MTDRHDGPSEGGLGYGLVLRLSDEVCEVALFRSRTLETRDLQEDVWTCRFGNREDAIAARDAMMLLPHRWPAWAMLAPIVGHENVFYLIAHELQRAALASSVGRSTERRRSRAVGAGGGVRMDLMLSPEAPRIVGHHHGSMFLVMRFEAVAEALRVWDWVRWQQHALASWHALFLRDGPDAVERLILEGMFQQEASVPASSALDANRPLRDWRPERRGSERRS